MVVFLNELPEKSVKVGLAQNNHVIQQLPAKRPNISLYVRILPWTLECRPNFFDSTSLEEGVHTIAVNPVIISKNVSRLATKGRRFPQLLDNPLHGWTICRCKLNDLPATVIEDKEDKYRIEAERRDCKEIYGPGYIHVIPEERKPGC